MMTSGVNRIDRDNDLPLYCQLRELLRRQIDTGAMKPGDQLPPEPALGQSYGLSRITVRQALADLVDEGYISRSRGKGTFVAERQFHDHRVNKLAGFLDTLREQGYESTSRVIGVDRIPAPAKVAGLLGLPSGHSVIRNRRLTFVRDEPIVFATGYLVAPAEVEILAGDLDGYPSIYPYLAERHGILLVRGDKTLEATLANEEESQYLHIRKGAPVLLAEIVVYDAEDRRRLLVKAAYRGDRYKYCMRLAG
jgi:GntR family transcriptional regulator